MVGAAEHENEALEVHGAGGEVQKGLQVAAGPLPPSLPPGAEEGRLWLGEVCPWGIMRSERKYAIAWFPPPQRHPRNFTVWNTECQTSTKVVPPPAGEEGEIFPRVLMLFHNKVVRMIFSGAIIF